MKWEKKGLIYVPDIKAGELLSHAAIPFVDKVNSNILRIYFSSRNLKGQSLPYYVEVLADDLKEIHYKQTKPLLQLGELGTFDDSGIMPSWITEYEGKKYMYYIAWNPQVTVSYRLSIGLAISYNNGKSYEKYSQGPICDRSINEPFFNTAPCVLIDKGIWKMWYISCTKWEIVNGYPEPYYHVKYAESKDGIHWEKTGAICIDYDATTQAIGRPCVIIDQGKYRMFYSFRMVTDYRKDRKKGYRIGYAESENGINWVRKDDKVGISISNDGWDSEMMEYCHVFNHNGIYYMVYNGNGFGKTGFGYAILKDE